ncbi:MAG: hypothetical protein AAF787_02390 [Chloroflexota bacterium]
MRRTIIRKVILPVAVVLLAGAPFILLSSFDVNPPGQFAFAVMNWRSHNIESYRIVYSLGSPDCIGTLSIEVHHNYVEVLTDEAMTFPVIPQNPETIAECYGDWLPATVEGYSVDRLHLFWESQRKTHGEAFFEICSKAMRYEIQHDPEYGYISSLQYRLAQDEPLGVGLLCPVFGVHSTHANVISFEVLED